VDPDEQRLHELARASADGRASEAEREELALYVPDEPQRRALVERARAQQQLGDGWLARVEADDALAAADRHGSVRLERGLGVGLLLAGLVASPFAPVFAVVATAAGGTAIVASLLRARWLAGLRDPYRDIER
jgi:hypothetical protein